MLRSIGAVAAAMLLGATAGLAQSATKCEPGNAGLELPAGFCATVYADSLAGVRHLWVAPNGDVFATRGGRKGNGIVALRDKNGDGRADERVQIASGFNSSEIRMFDGHLYTENTTAVLRFPYTAGQLEPVGTMDTVVKDLPKGGDHFYKTFIIDRDGSLYVNVGSADNACQEQNRAKESKGKNPCEELESRGGIWKFDARKLDQTQSASTHFARGIRNAVGMAISPLDGKLWVTQHGRDQLGGSAGGNWSFSDQYNAENPAEELLQVHHGEDFGWPYCYYAVEEHHLVLAPEYGGDGKTVGLCAQKKEPVAVFPAHWAPDALLFYTGSSFPARYKSGAFIAFHGSWNRAPEPQAGYRVVFQPLSRGKAAGEYETFADGFAPNLNGRGSAGNHRPVGLAEGPDGALYVADDAGGRIYKIVYTGK